MSNKKLGRRDFFKITGGALGVSALSYFFGSRKYNVPSLDNDLPDYVDDGAGLPVFRGPYLQKDVRLAAFLYPADIKKLTTLCDQTLNAVASPAYRYVPLMSRVVLVYADMLVSSLDERDTQIGSIPETEVGFWVLTVAMQKTSLGEVPHHLAWFLPTLLVDESNSIATGREVYGFNKQAGTFEKPQDIQSPRFTADVLGIKQFAPTAIAQKERLLELSVSSNEEQSPISWSDWPSTRDRFAEEILKSINPDQVSFAAQALVNRIPLVFLKQARSSTDFKKASYQKIVEAPLQIKEFYGGSMLTQSYTLNISALDSHPLMKKLGLESEQVNVMGAWLKVDFILGQGTEY